MMTITNDKRYDCNDQGDDDNDDDDDDDWKLLVEVLPTEEIVSTISKITNRFYLFYALLGHCYIIVLSVVSLPPSLRMFLCLSLSHSTLDVCSLFELPFPHIHIHSGLDLFIF